MCRVHTWLGAVGFGLLGMACADIDADREGYSQEAEFALQSAPSPEADAIKKVIKDYFDLKYGGMSDLKPRKFEHLVGSNVKPSQFHRREYDKRRVELDNAVLNDLRITEYNYWLNYDSIGVTADGTRATAKLRESHDVRFSINPAVKSMLRDVAHTVQLTKAGSIWLLEDDSYSDSWTNYIRESGLDTDALLNDNRKRREERIAAQAAPTPEATSTALSKAGEALAQASYSNYYPLNRTATVNYAYTWWNRRNPAYYDFSNLGGDCTNYVSQSLYAGGAPNDTSGSYVWYYYTSSNRSASWTGVDPLFTYLVNNYSPIGPYGYNTDFYSVSAGDVVQFRWAASGGFQHTMLIDYIYRVSGTNAAMYLAGHSNDTYDYPLSYIAYNSIRYIRIGGYLM